MRVLDRYPQVKNDVVQIAKISPGLSGAEVWQVVAHSETGTRGQHEYSLRKWPVEHPTRDHLAWIHRVATHAVAQGCSFIPPLIANQDGSTISQEGGNLWELTGWMPGQANFLDDPNSIRLKNMMESLARFHQAAAQVTLDFHVSRNVGSRIEQLNELVLTDRLARLAAAPMRVDKVPGLLNDQLALLRQRFVERATSIARPLLKAAHPATTGSEAVTIGGNSMIAHSVTGREILPVQPVLRDIWHDHVLFRGNEVTGLIDLGAMQIDSVAFDIARLLGSTVGDDRARWTEGVAYYQNFRRLSEAEQRLLPWIDQTAVLLGSWNWLRWLYLEHRTFTNWELVARRINHLRKRLETLACFPHRQDGC